MLFFALKRQHMLRHLETAVAVGMEAIKIKGKQKYNIKWTDGLKNVFVYCNERA